MFVGVCVVNECINNFAFVGLSYAKLQFGFSILSLCLRIPQPKSHQRRRHVRLDEQDLYPLFPFLAASPHRM